MNRTPLSTAVPDCNPSLSVFSQRIFNLPLPLFAIALLVMAAAIATDTPPSGMIGALLVMMLLGELLGFAGDRLPIIKTYLGGGAILALFGAAAMVYFGWLPKAVADDVASFMKGGGFRLLYRRVDHRQHPRHGCQGAGESRLALRAAAALLGAVRGAVRHGRGALLGFSPQDAVVVIAMPIMGGGMGAGAVPMSQIYEQLLGQPASYYISILVPALALAMSSRSSSPDCSTA